MIDSRFGNYLVVRKLGAGAMGTVYEAVHEEIGTRAAIKVLHPIYSDDPQIGARFLNEARAVNMVRHPGLVGIFEFGRTAEGATYLVMEYLEGDTLRARLERLRTLPVADALRIVRQIASALAAAHDKGIVHRDLKPENIILSPEPELPGGERAKLLDFGVAKGAALPTAALTQAGAFLGTPAYMAPEQCLGADQVDDKADIYALGVMLYELLTGVVPFIGRNLPQMVYLLLEGKVRPVRELAPTVSAELAALVMRLLDRDPARRPSARELIRALEALGAVRSTLLPASPRPQEAAAFVLRTSRATVMENYALIDHSLCAEDPNATLFATPNWNPGGQGGTYNDHHIGVWYTPGGRWSVYNQDRAALSIGVSFNVLIAKEGFVHRATASNIVSNWTLIDHPACNDLPNALVLVTANWNPGGQGQTYNDHAIGVWYTKGRWSVYNQDLAPMPPGAAFNVVCAEQTFCHRATASNLVSRNGTVIDHPAANGNPAAVVLVTANWNPGGQGGTYNDHAIGVYYGGGRWVVFNQDMAPMPVGSCFNVWIMA